MGDVYFEKRVARKREVIEKKRGSYIAVRSGLDASIGIVTREPGTIIIGGKNQTFKIRTEKHTYVAFKLPDYNYFNGDIENFDPKPRVLDEDIPWKGYQMGFGEDGVGIVLGERFYQAKKDELLKLLNHAIAAPVQTPQ